LIRTARRVDVVIDLINGAQTSDEVADEVAAAGPRLRAAARAVRPVSG
jgi:hypothetical protein